MRPHYEVIKEWLENEDALVFLKEKHEDNKEWKYIATPSFSPDLDYFVVRPSHLPLWQAYMDGKLEVYSDSKKRWELAHDLKSFHFLEFHRIRENN